MPFRDNEISAFLGRPLEYYHIQSYSRSYFYNPGKLNRTLNNIVYEGVYLRRTEIKQEKDKVTDNDITLTVDKNLPVTEEFKVITPVKTIWVTVWKKHLGAPDTEAEMSFFGRLRGVSWKNDFAELRCEPIGSMVKRAGLRLNYQVPCNHFLYSDACGVPKAQYQVNGTVSSINGNTITSPSFVMPSKPDWLKLGFVEYAGFYYTISSHNAATGVITTTNPIENLGAGLPITAYAGCNRSLTMCWDKFKNGLNYGGFPFSPAENVFATGLQGN